MAEKVVRRLGKRLNHIFQWVDSSHGYEHIWDLCCDHGRLGLHLHKHHPNSYVTLVDKVAPIVDQLVANYSQLNDGRLQFKVADACQLDIATEKPTLVIIAGVGGQNLIAMLDGILDRLAPAATLDFILSPNSHTFELRAFLRARPFTLIDEAFITEKNFSHEHLWLRYTSSPEADDLMCLERKYVSAVGGSLWQDMTETKRVYISKILLHHQRMLENRDTELSEAAIAAYARLL